MKVEFKEVSEGLLTTQFTGLTQVMPQILKANLEENAFITEVEEFPLLQTENGGRSSKLVPRIGVETVPEMRDPAAQSALGKICDFKNEVYKTLKAQDVSLKNLEYDQVISFHTYQCNAEGEFGFTPHIDFGMMAIVFTMGKDFEYSKDNGCTWQKLSEQSGVNSDTVIVNFGRLYSTFTGINPVLHRVCASGSLGDGQLSKIAKFTIGFFIEPKDQTKIPTEIPDHVQGSNRKNWEFLLENCETIKDYNKGRYDGTIIENEGRLQMAQVKSDLNDAVVAQD